MELLRNNLPAPGSGPDTVPQWVWDENRRLRQVLAAKEVEIVKLRKGFISLLNTSTVKEETE